MKVYGVFPDNIAQRKHVFSASIGPVAVQRSLSNSSFALRLWEQGELQQGLWGPAGLSRGLAVAGQPAGCGLPSLWRSHHLPLLDSHCSTLCGQVRPLRHTSWIRMSGPIRLDSTLCCVSSAGPPAPRTGPCTLASWIHSTLCSTLHTL